MNNINRAFRQAVFDRASVLVTDDDISIGKLNEVADRAEGYYCSSVNRGRGNSAIWRDMMRYIDSELKKL